jgi:hypothetical protein
VSSLCSTLPDFDLFARQSALCKLQLERPLRSDDLSPQYSCKKRRHTSIAHQQRTSNMFWNHSSQSRASASGGTDVTKGNASGGPPVDLLDLDMDFTFMSAERRQQLTNPTPKREDPAPYQYSEEDVLTPEVKMQVDRQDQPHRTNHNEKARGREFQSFYVAAAASRPTKTHRRRQPINNSPYRRPEYAPGYANYFDRDGFYLRRDHYNTARDRNASQGVLKRKFEAMADTDARDERDDYNRRGTDSYRGGGNKRRRDGEFISSRWFCLSSPPTGRRAFCNSQEYCL